MDKPGQSELASLFLEKQKEKFLKLEMLLFFFLNRGVPELFSGQKFMRALFSDLVQVLEMGVSVVRFEKIQFVTTGEFFAIPAPLESTFFTANG